MKANKLVISALAIMCGASMLMTGCGSKINADATLVTINEGEDTISLGFGNFMARYQQAMYDQYLMGYYGEGMWSSDMSGTGSTLEQETKDGILGDLEEMYLCKKHAADYGVELTEDDNKAIAEATAKFLEENPADTLKIMGATTETVTQYLEYRTYVSKVTAAVKEAAAVEISDEECWQRSFSYVLFNTAKATDADGNEIEITDEYIADMKQQAEALAAATDFDKYAEDNELNVSTDSYTKGEEIDKTFDMAVINVAEKLHEGEVSAVIEVEGTGYYVIRLDSEHDEEASESERTDLKNTAENNYYNEIYDGWESEITWEVNEEEWEKVKFDTLFKQIATEEDAEAENAEE